VDHADHVGLLRPAVTAGGGTWADIGAGHGAFTLALADLLGPGAAIVAVDRDAGALAANARSVADRFPATALTTLVADLRAPLELPVLDGLVAANSLHFVGRAEQPATISRLAGHLRPVRRSSSSSTTRTVATRGCRIRSRRLRGRHWRHRPAWSGRARSRASRAASSGRSTRPWRSRQAPRSSRARPDRAQPSVYDGHTDVQLRGAGADGQIGGK
jgi:SAM-dependent methyltransferase